MENLMIYREKFATKLKQKFPALNEWLYLGALAIYICAMALKGTMLVNFLVNERGLYFLSVLPAMVVLFKIIFLDEHDWKELAIFLLLEVVLFATGTNANEFLIFYFTFFIFGAKGIDIDKILKVFLTVNLFVIALAMFFSTIGSVKSVVVTRSDSPVLRFALGAVYPTDFASRIFYMMMAYAILRRFKFSVAEYISYIMLTIMSYILTDTRIDLLLMILLIICIASYRYLKKVLQKISPLVWTVLSASYVFLIILLGYLYTPNIAILEKINNFLSGRLFYENLAFKNYNTPLLGQFIYQNGFGGGFKVLDYFYIDSSYVRTLMMYGVVVTLLMIILFYYLFKRFSKVALSYWLVIFLLVILTSGIDQHLWDISYNFIFLALMANLSEKKKLNTK